MFTALLPVDVAPFSGSLVPPERARAPSPTPWPTACGTALLDGWDGTGWSGSRWTGTTSPTASSIRLGRLQRKGAPDTFDAAGYAALLERLADDGDEVVYAPAFERDLEQPVAGSIPVPPSARLVITEGNYLLVEDGAWTKVRGRLDEVWYIDLADEERRRRLLARHRRFGKSELVASEWVHGSDQRNADVVTGTYERADLRVPGSVLGTPRRASPDTKSARSGVP